jgi:hypothetical protein
MILGIFQPQMVKYLAKVETNLIFHGVMKESQENALVQNVLCLFNLKGLEEFLTILQKYLSSECA